MTTEDDSSKIRLRLPLSIHFEGHGVARNRLSLRDLITFGSQVQIALDRVALLLQGEPESVLRGRRPAEIEQACSLEIVSIQGGGSVTMLCDLPPRPQRLLGEFRDAGETALRVLVEGIDGISGEDERLPPGYDKGVLFAFRDAGKILDRGGIDRISFRLRDAKGEVAAEITNQTYERITRRIQSPVRNRRVIEGRLLMADFRESGLRCRVHPPLGPPVTCEFEEAQEDAILSAITHFVRVVGEAIESDGKVQILRIHDVELLDSSESLGIPGLEAARFESTAPTLEDLIKASPPPPTEEVLALAAGIWPESDDIDEFLESVREWRKEGGVKPLG
jgi:hypothetical protein